MLTTATRRAMLLGLLLGLMLGLLIGLGGCGTVRGTIDGLGHLGSGIIQDAKGVAKGVSQADDEASRTGIYH